MTYGERYASYLEGIEEGLNRYLPCTVQLQSRLLDAMHYSLFSGGKRVRPVMLLEFCRIMGGDVAQAMPFACALEMIHTYSLIHDDLPCMDNDSLRRGKPTNHRVFGEAAAVLAGDALLSAAFETMLDADYIRDVPPDRVLSAAHAISWASGAYGMAGGQMLDTDPEFPICDPQTLGTVHELKTGALFDAAARCGCLLAGADKPVVQAAASYARGVALAFQIRDDLLDAEEDTAAPDERDGRDNRAGKSSFFSLVGRDECLRLIKNLTEQAIGFLADFEDTGFLTWLARDLTERNS